MRLRILDPLRGLAALAVVLYHFSAYLLPSIIPNALTGVCALGTYGVQVFFVISGMVIPYAMVRSGYTLTSFPVFMVKRLIRICPPAWITSLVMIGFWYFQGLTAPRHVDLPWPGFGLRAIVGNITFLAPQLGTYFYNLVHWTLTAEFQFYVVIGILLPFMTGRSNWIKATVICLALSAAGYGGSGFFLGNAGSFVLGIALFLLHNGSIDRRVFWAITSASCVMMATQREPVWMFCSLGTMLVIYSGLRFQFKFTDWLGKVSYSLYIIHVPVGLFAENILHRHTGWHNSEVGKLLLMFGYTGLSLAMAGLFHAWVEAPFMRLAKRAGSMLEKWSGPKMAVLGQDARQTQVAMASMPPQRSVRVGEDLVAAHVSDPTEPAVQELAMGPDTPLMKDRASRLTGWMRKAGLLKPSDQR